MAVGYIGIDTQPSRHEYVESMLKKLEYVKEIYRVDKPQPDLFVITEEMPDSSAIETLVKDRICSIKGVEDAHINITKEFD